MSTAEKSKQVTERQVGLVIAPGLAAQIQTIQQVAQQFVQNYIEPMREAMEAFRKMVQRIIQPVREMLQAYATTFRFLTTFKPVYYVPVRPSIQQLERPIDGHLSVTNDKLGFFVINGERLRILHPSSSRSGKMLALLLRHRSQVVTYRELQDAIGSGDLKKDFKDLKYQLKKQGYAFDYELVRTEGIALIGLSSLQ